MSARSHTGTASRRWSTSSLIDAVMLSAYIAFWFAVAYVDIGKPAHMTDVTAWYMPYLFALTFAVPTYLGFRLGRDSVSDEQQDKQP